MSGLYLPGMEMPTPGRYEAVIIVLDKSTAEIAISPAEDDIGYWKEYPLVPVPPHGRLIDADALGIREAEKQAYEAYLREKGEFFTEEPLLEYMRGRLEGLTDASGRVRFAPTIIPADKEGEG